MATREPRGARVLGEDDPEILPLQIALADVLGISGCRQRRRAPDQSTGASDG